MTFDPHQRFANHVAPQQIPHPDEMRPGSPAPWSQLPVEDRRSISLARVCRSLIDSGRGDLGALTNGPTPEMRALAGSTERAAAVLVLLGERNGEAEVLLTRRASTLRSHAGEVSFPGGRVEVGEDVVMTALREAHEEVGLDPDAVEVVGHLTPIAAFRSLSAIWPIVAVHHGAFEPVADAREVERAYFVALATLAEEGNFVEEQWRRLPPRPGADREGFFPIHFYRVPGDLVWGATARMLSELLCVTLAVPWPEAQRNWQSGGE